jgi:hypothetical protein
MLPQRAISCKLLRYRREWPTVRMEQDLKVTMKQDLHLLATDAATIYVPLSVKILLHIPAPTRKRTKVDNEDFQAILFSRTLARRQIHLSSFLLPRLGSTWEYNCCISIQKVVVKTSVLGQT